MAWFGWSRRRAAHAAAAEPPTSYTALIAGRKRAMGVPYMLPADNEEVNRLDFQHYFLRYALHGNYAAPLDKPARILDVGTGTGRWAREMAQLFPSAEVTGLDITPPPADVDAGAGAGDVRPANYSFVAGNVLEGLAFPDAAFDFVHMRLLFSAIPEDRWPFAAAELARVTRPGGWVESVEAEPVDGAPALVTLKQWQIDLTRRRGVNIMIAAHVPDFLRGAGLQPAYGFKVPLPIGKHGGRVGTMVEANYMALLGSIRGFMTMSGIAPEHVFDETLAAARAELARGNHVSNFYVSYGQRPAQ